MQLAKAMNSGPLPEWSILKRALENSWLRGTDPDLVHLQTGSRDKSESEAGVWRLHALHTQGGVLGLSDPFFIWQIRAQSKITCFIKVKCGFTCTWMVESWHINCSRPETPNSWLTGEYQRKMPLFFPPTLSYKWKALPDEIKRWIRSLFKHQWKYKDSRLYHLSSHLIRC